MTINDLRVVLGAIGLLPTAMDKEFGLARANNPAVNENPHIIKAHNMLADIGSALEVIAQGLKVLDVPAEVVVQPDPPAAGGGDSWDMWKGPVSYNLLNDDDWKWIAVTSLNFDWKTIVNGPKSEIISRFQRGASNVNFFNAAAYIKKPGFLIQFFKG